MWLLLILVLASLSVMYIIFKQGRCYVMCAQHERPMNKHHFDAVHYHSNTLGIISTTHETIQHT